MVQTLTHNPRFHMIIRDEVQRRLLESARNVFSVMANITLEECHAQPVVLEDEFVTALISLMGDYNGMVAMHCPESLARRIAAGLLGVAIDVDSQDVRDAMGEVVNILGGDMKLYLDRGGRLVQLSLPSVVTGDLRFRDDFFAQPETVSCVLSTGEDHVMIGVQVCKSELALI